MTNLRSALRQISHDLGLKGQYTHDDVIRELRAKHSALIVEHSYKLQDMALKRMLCDAEAKQPKVYDNGQGELFPELTGFPESYDAKLLGLADKKGFRILTQKLKIKSLRAIADYSRPLRRNLSPNDKLKTYLVDLAPYIISDDDILEDVIKRSRRG